MARLNTYPQAGGLDLGDVFIIDGPRGTRTVDIVTIMEQIPEKYVDDDKLEKVLDEETSGFADIDFSEMFPGESG